MNFGYQKSKEKLRIKNEERHLKSVLDYESNPRRCAFCSAILSKKKSNNGNKFCNHSCFAKFSNRKRMSKRANDFCAVCGKSLRGKSGKKTCSYICSRKLRRSNSIQKWLSGNLSGLRGTQISIYVKEWLIEKRGEKCEQCGWKEKNARTGKIPINVEHIDGNYANNHPENLKLLCPSCHSLTPTYGSLNKGKGRPERRTMRK